MNPAQQAAPHSRLTWSNTKLGNKQEPTHGDHQVVASVEGGLLTIARPAGRVTCFGSFAKIRTWFLLGFAPNDEHGQTETQRSNQSEVGMLLEEASITAPVLY